MIIKLRNWLLSLMREAIRLEVGDRLSAMEAKLSAPARVVRTDSKDQPAKPKRPRTWSEVQDKLESGEIDTRAKA